LPQFHLLASSAGRAGAVNVAVTPTQVQALLVEEIAAWQAPRLDPAGARRLEGVQVHVGKLGTSIRRTQRRNGMNSVLLRSAASAS